MFRPATPLWAYVEQAQLSGKEVTLVTTGNSRFEQSETDAFARRVEARGGRLIRHVFLRRGRIFWHKSREELLKEVRAEMVAFKLTAPADLDRLFDFIAEHDPVSAGRAAQRSADATRILRDHPLIDRPVRGNICPT